MNIVIGIPLAIYLSLHTPLSLAGVYVAGISLHLFEQIVLLFALIFMWKDICKPLSSDLQITPISYMK